MIRQFNKLIILCLIVQATIILVARAQDVNFIVQSCINKLDFKSLAEFGQFVDQFSRAKDDEAIKTTGHNLTNKKGELRLVKRCLDERESILELDKLIKSYDKVRPCKYSEIGRLEEYANKYLFDNTKAIVSKFFTLFGVNIGINCKLNLLAHLKQADLEADQVDFIYSMASPSGWNVLINEYTKKSMKFGGSTHSDSNLINKIVKLVPGFTQVEHIDYLNFHHKLNDIKLVKGFRSINYPYEMGSYKLLNGQEKRNNLIESIGKIINSCKNLDQFYLNSILSLARLKELGLLVNYLNEFQEPSLLLHKWLAAASFCQLMVRVRLIEEHKDKSEILFQIVHQDDLLSSRQRLYSYVAQFDEITEAARENVWRASVSGGQWRQKSEAIFPTGCDSSVAMKQVRQFIKGLELAN